MNRDFKGVWIPKEIWINKDLTWMEKLFFVEIDSLDNKDGCFASNTHFSSFFSLTPMRCSQIVNSLIKKEYLSVRYEKEGKVIKRRVLNIFYRGIKYSKLGIKNSLGGIKKTKGGYKENDEGSNTNISNTINNTKEIYNGTDISFNNFWNTYDKKKGYKKCLPKWNNGSLCKEKKKLAIDYIAEYKEAEPDKKFRQNPLTYLNGETWNDELIKEETPESKQAKIRKRLNKKWEKEDAEKTN